MPCAHPGAIGETVDKFGALHVLLNSAGIGLGKTVEDITLEEWRKVHAIDLDGVFLGCKHGVAEIKKHTQRLGGSVINIVSIAGLRPSAGGILYSFSKAGLIMMTRSWAQEFSPKGVRVNAIAPGLIKTDFSEFFWKDEAVVKRIESTQPIRHIAEPDAVSFAALYLASDEASYVTGQTIVIDGGATIS